MATKDQAVESLRTSASSLAVDNALTMPQTGKLNLLKFPPEIRNKIYHEALVTPYPGIVRSFAPPALLQVNKMVREEAMAIFYAFNHFEITVKRARRHQSQDPHSSSWSPDIDNYTWHNFFTMWGMFSSMGSNVLQHVTRITVIYELSMDTGFPFGVDTYDKRVGFRFFGGLWEEEIDDDYLGSDWEGSDSGESDSDDSGSDTDSEADEEFRQLDDKDFKELRHDLRQLRLERRNRVPFMRIRAPRAPDFDPVGVFELADGDFNWPSRRDTHFWLYERVNEYETGQLWGVYPIHRLTDLLWRCVKDCPLAARSVDFLCEDYQYWISGGDGEGPYTEYDPKLFYNPEDEES